LLFQTPAEVIVIEQSASTRLKFVG
jgi:hypothetical protein